MITLAIEIVVVLSVCLFFVKPQIGVSVFSLIYFLVPTLEIVNIGGISLKWNYINAILLIAVLCYVGENIRKFGKLYLKPLLPFIIYYIVLLAFIPFEWATPISYQITSWIGAVFRYLVFPVAICVFFKSAKEYQLRILNYAIYFVIIVCCVYCLFLTQMRGVNPYLFLFNTDSDSLEMYFAAEDTGRIFGRISSVFPHPMNFGCFLVCSFFYCLYQITRKHERWISMLLVLITLSGLVCGVRSVLVGIAAGLVYFVFINGKTNYFKYALVFGLLFFIVILQDEDVYNYVSSIYDSSQAENVQGSNIQMRLRQLQGCFIEMADNPLFGNGYNWTIFYNQNYGNHPYCIAFESLIFIILCNWSIAGALLWCWLLIKLYKLDALYHLRKIDSNRMLSTLTIAFFAYVCLTGDYGYNMFWIYFYAVIYINMNHNYKKSKYGLKSNSTLSTSVLSVSRE